MSELMVVEEARVTASAEEQLVTMTVDGQVFGVPILAVQDIVEPRQITPVPLAPSAIAGVMNLRGRIVTVIDLRHCLGKMEDRDIEGQMGVTVEYQGDLYTMLVDSIGDVVALPKDDFEKPPATLDENLKRLCTGVYRRKNDLLVVLDVERILDAETIMRTPTVTRRRRDGQALRRKKSKGSASATKRAADAESDDAEEGKIVSLEARRQGNGHDASADPPTPESATAEEEAVQDAAEPEPTEPPLYDRLGGEVAVDAAVDLFYRKVLEDPKLAPFFEGVDMERQAAMMKEFMTMALGGPSFYSGRGLREAHASLVKEKGLSDEHFDAFARHLSDTLEVMEVPASLIEEVLAVVESTRKDVLGR